MRAHLDSGYGGSLGLEVLVGSGETFGSGRSRGGGQGQAGVKSGKRKSDDVGEKSAGASGCSEKSPVGGAAEEEVSRVKLIWISGCLSLGTA